MACNNIQLKFFVFIFFWLFCIQISSSQDCEYGEYYRLTDLARESFSKKKYKDTQKYFQQAFSKTDFPLGRDLGLALFTANELQDDTWAKLMAEKLAKGGIPLRYFVRFKMKKWYSDFESEFENYSNYYDENFNQELRQELILLFKKDLETNNEYHKWRTREIDLSLSELIDGASEMVMDFERIVSKYGFPYEKAMGYNYVWRKNSVEPYNIEVLMIHTYGRGVFFLKTELSNIVCKGGLPPNYEETLKNIRGLTNGSGFVEEMTAIYYKNRGKE